MVVPAGANTLWASGLSATNAYGLATAGYATGGALGFMNTTSQGANASASSVLMQPVNAAFGAYMPVASFMQAGGSLAGGLIDYGAGGQFIGGRGWNLGGTLGGLAGGGLQYGWRGIIGESVGGIGGAGLGYYRTGTFDGALQYGNYGMMIGGFGQGGLGLLGRSNPSVGNTISTAGARWRNVAGDWRGWREGFSNSGRYAWGNVRRRWLRDGFAEPRQAIHHRIIPQGGTRGGAGQLTRQGFFDEQWGRYVPNFIKNGRWNMRRVGVGGFDDGLHAALHGNNPNMRLRLYQRLWYGSNAYDKGAVIVIIGGGVYVADQLLND